MTADIDMQRILVLLVCLLALCGGGQAQNVSVSGAIVGNGSYPTLTAAFAALNGGVQSGAAITVSILNDTYEGTGTALLNAGTWASLTVVPVGQPRTITGATTAGQPMIDLNGADKVAFSGLLGGQQGLIFFNSTASGTVFTSTIRLRADAQNNSFTYCKILGASTTDLNTAGGNLLFAPGTAGGTRNVTIDHCDFGPGNGSLPSKCIYNYGSTTLAHMNQLITISNCHFYDYFSGTLTSAAIMLREGALTWTITGNRFYQNDIRTKTTGTYHYDIVLGSTFGNVSHQISYNIFGTRPNASPAQSRYYFTHKDAVYNPILLISALYAPNQVTFNQIKDIIIESAPLVGGGGMFAGIINGGSNGGLADNIIGSLSDSTSILLIGRHTGGTGMAAIGGGQADNQSFVRNQIGGIQVHNLAGGGATFTGIGVTYYLGDVYIEDNVIGSADAPIRLYASGGTSLARGIVAQVSQATVEDNTVAHMYCHQSHVWNGLGPAAIMHGMRVTGATGSSSVLRRNTVHTLVNSHPTNLGDMVGITSENVAVIENNLLHTLYMATADSRSYLIGLELNQGNPDISNNMIRLGFSPTGVPMTTGLPMFGIHNLIGRPRIDCNSIYLGGTGVRDTADTYAIYSMGGHPNIRFVNNILMNARSNGTGTGTHYAIAHGGNPQFPPLPTSNGNDLYTPGVGGVIGRINGQDQVSIFDWRLATGHDFNSISSDPNFINPTGTTVTGDLHIAPASPIEGQGVAASPFLDFDAQIRSAFSPHDIGADAGNFTPIAVTQPELEVRGNTVLIQNGDSVPSNLDGTDFGTISGCSGASTSRSFILRNIGNANLTYSGVVVTGSSAFAVTPSTGGTLTPGQSFTFTVQFAASAPGTYAAMVQFGSNDQDEAAFNYEVQAVVQADNVAPVANCQAIIVPIGSNGIAMVNASALGSGSTDNCAIASYTAMPAQFTCSQLGTQTVQLAVADAAGNTSTCSANVSVVDNTAPAALCQPVTVQLDSNGVGATTAAAVNNGSTDNCGISATTLSATSFTCAQVGTQSVTLTVTDAAGNAGTCTATVSVVDNLGPSTTCAPVTLSLNASGQASLTPTLFGSNPTDNCGIASQVLSQSLFDCTDLGPNAVTVTVSDAAGNVASCTQTVTVVDNQLPVASCQPANLSLNAAGQAPLSASLVDGGSADNCAIAVRSVSTSQFTCAQLGSQPVLLTVTDASGNTATCSTTVNVLDYTAPVASCQPASIALNASGTATLNLAALDAGSTDNCGIDTLVASQLTFTCAHIGSNSVQLTVVDASGNDASCTATVTVTENVPPIAVCQPVTLSLNGAGQAQLPGALINGGSSDNCGIATLLPSQFLFNCSHVGVQPVTLTVTDGSGNTATCTAQVSIVDATAPAITCTNLIVTVPSSGAATITPAMVGSATDLCGIAGYQLSQSAFTCGDIGANSVQLTATDIHGNSSTCTATVTATATPLSLQLNPPALGPCGHHLACAGMANATATASSSGACAPYTYAWSGGQAGATATSLGAGTHSVTVTSADGQQQVQAITLTAPTPLIATVIGTSSCPGSNTGSASAAVSGGQSCQTYTYLWSNGLTTSSITGLAPGGYQLTVTDAAGCTDTASITIGTWPASSVAITQGLGTLVATPGFAVYQWYNSVGAIPGATAGQFTPLADGNYYVIATDGNGCSWTSAVFPFVFVGAQAAGPGWVDIVLYPNPGQGVFRFDLVQALQGPLRVEVTDMHGRILYDAHLDALDGNRVFDLSELAAGMYLVRLIGEEQRMYFRLLRE
jgi:hypothetical protein